MRWFEQNVLRVINLIHFGFTDSEIADKLRETDGLNEEEIFFAVKGAKALLKLSGARK